MLEPQERTAPVTGEPAPVAAPFSAAPGSANGDRWATLFPAEGSQAAHPPWWQRRWRLLVAAAVVLALVATTLVATDAFGSKPPVYRSATVADHPVSAVVDGVATIEPVSQATVAFPVGGTVANVDVAVGQQVTAGQALAKLDTQTLMTTLHTRQAALARAQLTLSKALAGDAVGSPSAGTGGGGGAAGGGSSSTGFQTASTATSPSGIVLTAAFSSPGGLAQAQQAVLQAQQQVDAALAASQVAVQQEASVCANVTTTAQGAGAPGGVRTSGTLTACQTAIQNVENAQQQVTAAQTALAHATSALDALLGQRASNPGGQGGSQAPSGGATGSGSGSTTGSGSGGANFGGSGGSRSGAGSQSRGATASGPTAADLVAFQASVDAAQAQVAVAYQAVAQATIATPIAGTVMALNLAAGDSVSAGSSTENVVIAGPGGYEVSTTVGVTQIPDIALGQPATVVPDGSHRVLPGRVVQISTTPTSSSSSDPTTYTVVVGLTNPTAKLNNGATGSVSIVTKRVTSALAVPTSAIVTNGTRHSVMLLDGGKASSVNVGVGVLGATWTQVTSGLHRGQHVALATVSAPLPSSATNSTNGTNRNGGRGGTGFGGGGGGFRVRFGGGAGG
jgi:HlyD family secretion protein